MRSRLVIGIFPVLAAAVVVCGAAWADSDHNRARAALQAGEIQPLARALEKAESRFTGHVLEVELEEEDDGDSRFLYEMTILTDRGHVLKLEMDARTLEILEVEGAEAEDD